MHESTKKNNIRKKNTKNKQEKSTKIEILDFEDHSKAKNKTPKKKKYVPKMVLKSKFKFIAACLTLVLVFVMFLSLITKTNYLKVGMTKFLNGLGIYTEEINSISIESEDYDDPGSWVIYNDTNWIGPKTAEVTLEVESMIKTDEIDKDIILVIDRADPSNGDKLYPILDACYDVLYYMMETDDRDNRLAIITYDSTATILSPLSNDLDGLYDKLDKIEPTTGGKNYNAALQKVDELMSEYTKEKNREIITVFTTTGYPTIDTPNQVGTYELLKEKYPYMDIKGFQYGIGSDPIYELEKISDMQKTADNMSVYDDFFDTALSPYVYETFTVTNYIDNDYFIVNSKDDIKVDRGMVKFEKENGIPKITWKLDREYATGDYATMRINLQLKEDYWQEEGFFPTNKKIKVTTKFSNEKEKTETSTKTTVLKNLYKVYYDTNTPKGCSLPSIASEDHLMNENITIKSDELSCDGYLFKGWVISGYDEYDIQKVNDEVFIMPGHDVTITGTWTKQAITKSMDGTVYEKTTLYRVLQNEAKTGTYAKEYTGSHQDSLDGRGKRKIYYYHADNSSIEEDILNKNNVIFADHCWQMYRTTDTGGVKLLYNGEVVENKCMTDRHYMINYQYITGLLLSSNYWYGTEYTYDAANNVFSISGTKENALWNDDNWQNLVGKYTCRSASEDGTCQTIYHIKSYVSSTKATALGIDRNDYGRRSTMGTSKFNEYNYTSETNGYVYDTPGSVGYMTNTRYRAYNYKFTTIKNEAMNKSSQLKASIWFGHDIILNSPYTGYYSLDNPYRISSSEEYLDLIGEYSIGSTSKTGYSKKAQYIVGIATDTDTPRYYYLELASGNSLETYNDKYTYGETYSKNDDGTYTINDPKTIEKINWFNDYEEVGNNKYVCKNAVDNTCSELWYVTRTSRTNIEYIEVGETYKYSKGFTYENGVYKLNEDESVTMWNLMDENNRNRINNAHYTCWNQSGECETLSYIFWYGAYNKELYYIQLTNGNGIEDVLNEMLYDDDVNTNDSNIKMILDEWYQIYLTDYTDYLEDAVFCYDRSISNKGGWNPNGGSITSELYFNRSTSLACSNDTDKFSINNTKAKLKYKIGLLTYAEAMLMNMSLRKADQARSYWLGSPSGMYGANAMGSFMRMTGEMIESESVTTNSGVRPVISLRPGLEYSSGDGSMDNPYIVNLNS